MVRIEEAVIVVTFIGCNSEVLDVWKLANKSESPGDAVREALEEIRKAGGRWNGNRYFPWHAVLKVQWHLAAPTPEDFQDEALAAEIRRLELTGNHI